MKHNFRLRPLQCAVLLSLTYFANGAYALKLGDPVVKSYVGQPLVAEFNIEDSTREEMKMLKIALAKPEVYGSFKALFHPSLKTSSLSIIDKNETTPKLVFKTIGPVEDSVVDLVFELTWAAGKMVQASTVLIDPAPEGVVIDTPVFESTPVPIVETEKNVPSQSIILAEPVKSLMPGSPQKGTLHKLPRPRMTTTPGGLQQETDITVRKGDTLGNIATRHAIPGVKLEQLLIAIYNKNSKVIASANINLIQEGVVLALPTKEEALAVDAKAAMKTVALHASNFRLYAQKLAATSKPVVANSSKDTKSAIGRVQSDVTEKGSRENDGKDTVQVARGISGNAVGNTPAKVAERLAIEKNIQTKKALVEAQERQAMLDKNAKDLADLVLLKNAQLARLQQNNQKSANVQADVKPVDRAVPSVKTSEAKTLTPEAIAAARHAASASTSTPTNAVPDTQPAVAPHKEVMPEALPNEHKIENTTNPVGALKDGKDVNTDGQDAKPAVKPRKVPKPITGPIAPPPEPEETLIESLMPFGIVGGAAGVVALITGLFYKRRKKKVNNSESSTVFGDTAGKADADSESRDTTASTLDSRLTFDSIASDRDTEVEHVVSQPIHAETLYRASKAITLNNPIVLIDKHTEPSLGPELLSSVTPKPLVLTSAVVEKLDSVAPSIEHVHTPVHVVNNSTLEELPPEVLNTKLFEPALQPELDFNIPVFEAVDPSPSMTIDISLDDTPSAPVHITNNAVDENITNGSDLDLLLIEDPIENEFDFDIPVFEAIDPLPSMSIDISSDEIPPATIENFVTNEVKDIDSLPSMSIDVSSVEGTSTEGQDPSSDDFSMSRFHLDPVSEFNPVAVEAALQSMDAAFAEPVQIQAMETLPELDSVEGSDDTQSLSGNPLEQLDIARFYISLNDYIGALDLITGLLDHPIDGIKTEAREMYTSIPESVRLDYTSQISA